MRISVVAQTALVASLTRTTLAHSTHNLFSRTTNCGPAYGGAVCDPGQCCSSAGVCGTGSSCIAPDCLFQYGPACDANQTPPGVNTSSITRPQFGNVPYGTTITKCNQPGKVALTFDDGPYLYTSDLLDLLKANNIKATFFVTANNGGKGQIENDSTGYPAILRRAYSEGHQIASHTWSHQDLSTLSQSQILDQVIKNEIAFEDIFGFFPTYLRPPYGRCDGPCLSTLGSLGYHVVTWNLETNDWKEDYPTSQATFSGALKAGNPSTDSFIELSHDIHYGTVHGFAQYMIDTLKAAGYTTTLVGDCLNDPPANWYRDAKTGQQWAGNQASSSPAASSTTSSTTSKTSSTSSSTSTSSSSSSTSSSSSHATTSSKTHSTSTSTFPSVHSIITIAPSFQHLSATLDSSALPSSSTHASGCASNFGACVLQGLGGASSSATSTAATNSAASSASINSASNSASNSATKSAAPFTGASSPNYDAFCMSTAALGVVGALFMLLT